MIRRASCHGLPHKCRFATITFVPADHSQRSIGRRWAGVDGRQWADSGGPRHGATNPWHGWAGGLVCTNWPDPGIHASTRAVSDAFYARQSRSAGSAIRHSKNFGQLWLDLGAQMLIDGGMVTDLRAARRVSYELYGVEGILGPEEYPAKVCGATASRVGTEEGLVAYLKDKWERIAKNNIVSVSIEPRRRKSGSKQTVAGQDPSRSVVLALSEGRSIEVEYVTTQQPAQFAARVSAWQTSSDAGPYGPLEAFQSNQLPPT